MTSLWGYPRCFIEKLKTYVKGVSKIFFILRKVKCNICGWKGKSFDDFDCGFGRLYKDSTCPSCQSQPRHRSFYFYFKKVLPQNTHVKLLHFAPEEFLTRFLKTYQNIEYLSVDINEEIAMQKEDITSLTFDDLTFDIILCSHVLEHIEDDQRAMMELYRVLKKGGFAILDVPMDINREHTYEDRRITSYEERAKAFWQYNHVRLYGRDFPDKLRSVGFEVTADHFNLSLGRSKMKYYGLGTQPIYYCKKQVG